MCVLKLIEFYYNVYLINLLILQRNSYNTENAMLTYKRIIIKIN
jgi:hypothetical protein